MSLPGQTHIMHNNTHSSVGHHVATLLSSSTRVCSICHNSDRRRLSNGQSRPSSLAGFLFTRISTSSSLRPCSSRAAMAVRMPSGGEGAQSEPRSVVPGFENWVTLPVWQRAVYRPPATVSARGTNRHRPSGEGVVAQAGGDGQQAAGLVPAPPALRSYGSER